MAKGDRWLGPRVTIDFEGRSQVSLDDVGGWMYSRHPTTEVMCLAYHLPGDPLDLEHVRLWHAATPSARVDESPPPGDLFDAIGRGVLLEAHNAGFEWDIWHNVMVPRYNWPQLDPTRVACSAAKAAALALPRALEDVCRVLRTPVQKDMEGHALMRRMSKPTKLSAKARRQLVDQGEDPDSVVRWIEDRDSLERQWLYCQRDVLAEAQGSELMPDLPRPEWELYLLDQEINRRGFRVDREGLMAVLQYLDVVNAHGLEEMARLTGGLRPTQRQKVKAWLAEHEVFLPDTQGTTVDAVLKRLDLPTDGRKVLEILRAINRTSTAKYRTLQAYMDEDDRVRRTLVYHGASTGRWTGSGPQPHNFPRGTVTDMPRAWADVVEVARQDAWDWFAFLHGDPMETLSGMTRGSIVASKDHDFVVADFSAIEACVVMWLAGESKALETLRQGKSLYCELASDIYDRPIDKKSDPSEYMMGKQGILGLGFGMGPPKFVTTVFEKAGIAIDQTFSKKVVDRYRKKYSRVPAEWLGQEAAAIAATLEPSRVFRYGKIQWKVSGRFLKCRLPSGRCLYYCDPVVVKKITPWGEERDCLTFMAVDPKTKQWVRQDTYGGMIVENIVQAIARDLLATAMKRAVAAGYSVVLTVHDEVIAEVLRGLRTLEHFVLELTTKTDWATDCPVRAEGWVGDRYRKD